MPPQARLTSPWRTRPPGTEPDPRSTPAVSRGEDDMASSTCVRPAAEQAFMPGYGAASPVSLPGWLRNNA